ncbi:unnamed protein product [Porites evermanni]|uniref:Uncharacterized protein n=1 Tax=Porites evermanni TaxID=104178 RepID=A0ABN8SQT3_9CNID|nr:unnamed protein product [Porites evermanni]
MDDLSEHIALLGQATKQSKAPQDYHAQASPLTEAYMVHLLTVASNVIVFDKGKENPLITSLLNAREIKEFVCFFRTNFPDKSFPPQLHVLEEYVIPFRSKWHFPLGFFS